MTQTQTVSDDSTELQEAFADIERLAGLNQISLYEERITYRNLTDKQYPSQDWGGSHQYVEVYEFVSIVDDEFTEGVVLDYTVEPARDCDDELLDFNGQIESESRLVESVEEAVAMVEEFVENSR